MALYKDYLEAIKDHEKTIILQLEELILIESVNFYKKRGIHWLSAPITTGTISSPMGLGSDSLPVKISIDGRDTYLADSMQFLLEYGCRFFNNGCWYIMPTFRGEDVDDRHLKQFFHSEAEVPGNLNTVMDLVDDYIKHLATRIQDIIGQKKHLTSLVDNEIPRISFDEVAKILGENKIEHKETWRNITAEGEKDLIRYFDGPVWVTHYDEEVVPFYQCTEDKKAKNADLLMGIGETVGCGERWISGEEVLESLKKHQNNRNEYEWYIEMKNAFPMKTSGFGMGIERFLLFVLEKNDIRDMQIFRRFNDGKDVV